MLKSCVTIAHLKISNISCKVKVNILSRGLKRDSTSFPRNRQYRILKVGCSEWASEAFDQSVEKDVIILLHLAPVQATTAHKGVLTGLN